MNPSSLAPLILVTVFVIATWFRLDMRSILRALKLKNQLSIEGRWTDLERYFERESKTLRPFVWLHRKYLLPGNLAGQHALFLRNQGRLEEALVKVGQAIRQIERKPWIFSGIHRSQTFNTQCAALRARTMILVGLGRYEEAREASARLQQLSGGAHNAALALLEYYCGHLDAALAQAQSVLPTDKQYDTMCGITALAWSMKGDPNQAIQALSYEPANVSKFYSAAGLSRVSASPDGPEFLELQQRKLAGVFQPARLVLLAGVYMSIERFEDAARALDQAEKVLGPEPGGQISYWRHRACCLAAQQKPAETENCIGRMREMVQQLPARAFLLETHFAAGRSYLYLGRFQDALDELTEAQRFLLHPIERHVTAYWLAQTHDAAGNKHEAASLYRLVAADPIPSWMRNRAAEALPGLSA